jgi:primosomal protein N'
MHLVSVIPLIKGISKNTLSYLSADELPLGGILDCPINKRTVACMVLSCIDVRQAKQEIRQAEYSIKKIVSGAITLQPVSTNYIRALLETANHYGLPYSDVFQLLVPTALLSVSPITKVESKVFVNDKDKSNIQYSEVTPQQAFDSYINLIQSNVYNKICVIVPTIKRAKVVHARVNTAAACILLHSKVTKTKQQKLLQTIADSDTYICICTPQYLAAMSTDTYIVVDEYHSSAYISVQSPQIDYRVLINHYTELAKSAVLISDTLLPEYISPEQKYIKPEVIDMTDSSSGSNYIWQSAQLHKVLEATKLSNSKVLLHVTRKGLATQTVCSDCKTVLLCDCATPLVLHSSTSGNRYYECPACATQVQLHVDDTMRCKNCDSWNLTQLGITSELVEADLTVDGYQVVRVDSDIVTTETELRRRIELFETGNCNILVATNMALPYISKPVDIAAAVSLDSLLSLPGYDTDFRVLRTILELQSLSKQKLLIQTRMPKHTVFRTIQSTGVRAWKEEYVSDLRELLYPPYGIILQIQKLGVFTSKERRAIEHFCQQSSASSKQFRAYSTITVHFTNAIWELSSVQILFELRQILGKQIHITVT